MERSQGGSAEKRAGGIVHRRDVGPPACSDTVDLHHPGTSRVVVGSRWVDALKRADVRFNRRQTREHCGWSDFQVRTAEELPAAGVRPVACRGPAHPGREVTNPRSAPARGAQGRARRSPSLAPTSGPPGSTSGPRPARSVRTPPHTSRARSGTPPGWWSGRGRPLRADPPPETRHPAAHSELMVRLVGVSRPTEPFPVGVGAHRSYYGAVRRAIVARFVATRRNATQRNAGL